MDETTDPVVDKPADEAAPRKRRPIFSNHPKAAAAVMVGSIASLIIWGLTAAGIQVSAQHAADIQAVLMGLAAFLTPSGDAQ